jgi:hypothetical protein
MESDVAPLSTPDPTGAGTQTAHYAIAPTHPGRTHSLSSQHVSLQRSTGYYVYTLQLCTAPWPWHAEGHIKYKCATRIAHMYVFSYCSTHTRHGQFSSLRNPRSYGTPGPGAARAPPAPRPRCCPVSMPGHERRLARERTATFSSPLSVFLDFALYFTASPTPPSLEIMGKFADLRSE